MPIKERVLYMKSVYLFLSLSFFVACGVPSNQKTPVVDPYKLSCEEAINRFSILAKQADSSCQKDSDCVGLGSQSNCDTFCHIPEAKTYSTKNIELVAVHNRIFENHNCNIHCTYHHQQSIYTSTPICKDGQCNTQIGQKQECFSLWP